MTQSDSGIRPRTGTGYYRDGRYLVSRVSVGDDLRASIRQAVGLIGGFERAIEPGDTVTIKPNLNTADPYPASSDPAFLEALALEIFDAGAEKIRFIDSSTLRVKSRGVAEKIGLTEMATRIGAELIFLEECEWKKVDFPKGTTLKRGSVGVPLLDTGKLVLAPCLKTHTFAKFTASMKLFVGLLKKEERLKMHFRNLEEKIADLASFFRPDLIVMDARKVFVTGGPMSGQVETPNVILAGGDMVSIDVTGVRILQSYNAKNRLGSDVWELPQIRQAARIGIGASSDEDIKLIAA